MTLNTQQILSSVDLPREEVDVPEWGGVVLMRGLTGSERDLYEQSIVSVGTGGKVDMKLVNFRARLVSLCMIGEDGNHLASEEELAGKSAIVINRLFDIAQRLSGMKDNAVEEAKDKLKKVL